jgi:cation diffusion facilitator CzcD-associated flavoprotein CzcO
MLLEVISSWSTSQLPVLTMPILYVHHRAVVLATGPEVVPYEPPLKGRELFKDVAHSCRFKDGSSYKGKKVLVVSGCDRVGQWHGHP